MRKVVTVASREALLSLDAVYGLAAFLESLGLPRRRVLDWLADVLFGWVEQGGVILDADGDEIVIGPDTIDDAHGEDGSAKWVSDAQRPNPPLRRRRQSMWLRLALYDAACRITTGRSIVDFSKEDDA